MILEKVNLITSIQLFSHVELGRCFLIGSEFAERLQRNPLIHIHRRLVLFLRLDHLRIVVVYDYNLNVFPYFVLIVSVVLRERGHGTILFIALIPFININSTVRLKFKN